MVKKFRLDSLGLEVVIGKFARQADGAVWISKGKNIVLATAVATEAPKDFMGFFPLTVEYRERMSAAGKFPGGFIKREGKLSDFEILSSRLIDRAIRPLFSEFYFNEVQILSTVYSSDGEYPVDVLALIGSSLALTISPIPFLSPVGAVRISRVSGKWIFNSTHEEHEKSDVEITVAGTADGICMVEGNCNNLKEDELIDVLLLAHEQIKEQVEWQNSIQRELEVLKVQSVQKIDWESWSNKVKNALPKDFAAMLYTQTKQDRSAVLERLREDLSTTFAKELEAGELSKSELLFLFDVALKENFPDVIIAKNSRIDGRAFDQIRPISVEVSLLPCVHGSALFTRGETQALVSLTLGTSSDVQKMEPLIGESIEKTFMLHYNFPPFSTGEVKAIRGIGRRELGHGYLAETSFAYVLPSKTEFPYTIRSISDVLESNGSSSMASVCGTTMALMDAGVPITDMVSGIAMGLMKDSAGNFCVLSDILGTEDAFGLMDFKVTGTQKGIMAVQMDIKAKSGITKQVLKEALEQARVGRIHILNIMKQVMNVPRPDISSLAPRITTVQVPQDKIGAIIGPQGKNIKEIIANTGVEIDIEEDGTVNIFTRDSNAAKKAIEYVKLLAGEIEIGSVYEGKVKKIADFGIFVDIFPGKSGLVHISSIAKDKQNRLHEICKIDSDLTVKVTGYDKETGRIRLIAPSLEYSSQNR